MFALQKEEELSRLEVLANLQVNSKIIIVASAIALMQKVMPLAEFQQISANHFRGRYLEQR